MDSGFTVLRTWSIFAKFLHQLGAEVLLPATTKLWPRLCFYSCLWFSSQGVSACWEWSSVVWEGSTPSGKEAVHAGKETSPGRKQCMLGRKHPLWEGSSACWEGSTPLGSKQCMLGRKHTPQYGQWAAGMHPTGMHSCCRYMTCWFKTFLEKLMVFM